MKKQKIHTQFLFIQFGWVTIKILNNIKCNKY